MSTFCTCTYTPTASLPGLHAWVGKSEPSTHSSFIFSSPRISGSWEKFHQLCEACRLQICERYLPLTTLCVDNDEAQRYSALCLQKLSTHSFIPAKRYNTWLMQHFCLKVTDCRKWSSEEGYCHLYKWHSKAMTSGQQIITGQRNVRILYINFCKLPIKHKIPATFLL